MHTDLTTHCLLSLETMSPPDMTVVLANACNLQRAAESGKGQPLLRGKNIGLLCESNADRDLALFRRAAIDLGAHVARIRPSLTELSTAQEISHTARMLGRLYDAVVCQGMARCLVEQLQKDAGVPVFDSIATWEHPILQLAECLGEGSAEDRQRFMLQAVLLATLG